MNYKTTFLSPIGEITLSCDGKSLTGLWIEKQKYHGATILSASKENDDLPIFTETKKWLSRYFSGEKPRISVLALHTIGSEFRQGVWDILCDIPYGETTTYGEIAKKMAKKMNIARMSSQAVGGAVGHNPISIIIPCHRVVGSNGSLTGYAGGIATKIKLLEIENVDISRFFIPKKGTAL